MSVRHYATVINCTEKHIDYTIGFYLIRLKNNTDLQGQLTKDELNKYIVAGACEPREGPYPNIDAVVPDTTDCMSIEFNGKFMADILKVITAESKEARVTLYIKDSDHSIVLTCDEHQGVLVPLRSKGE